MRIAIVTCIWKRPALTRRVLDYYREMVRKTRKHDLFLIVAGSEGDESRELVQPDDQKVFYIETPNKPLGAKWNATARKAYAIAADAILVVGSDDLISREIVMAYAESPRNAQGLLDCYVADLLNGHAVHWPGYSGKRRGETVGAGRFLTSNVLKSLNWQPWDPDVNRGLDGSMDAKMHAAGPRFRVATMADLGGSLICMKHRTMLTGAERTGGEPVSMDILPEWAGEFRRSWTVGLDMIAKGDDVVGVATTLRSIRHVVDDARVRVDTRYGDAASTAATLMGCHRVIEMPAVEYKDTGRIDFATTRNELLESGDSDWCLVLDSDEVLVSQGDLLPAIDRAEENGVHGVSVAVRIDDITVRQVRAFRRDKARWRFPMHNQICGIEYAMPSNAVIRTSYAYVEEERRERARPVLEDLFENGDEDEREHAAYFLAKAAATARDWFEMFRWTGELTRLCPEKKSRASFWCWHLEGLREAGEFELLRSVLDEARKHHPDYDGLLFYELLATFREWATRAMQPGEYVMVPTPTRERLRGFNLASQALGLGSEIGETG